MKIICNLAAVNPFRIEEKKKKNIRKRGKERKMKTKT